MDEQLPPTLALPLLEPVVTLDPANGAGTSYVVVASQIFEGLTGYSTEGKLEGRVAERWESKDFRTWRFHLRGDVFFQPDPAVMSGKGRRVVAADVKQSFERLLRKETGASGAWLFRDLIEGAPEFARGTASEIRGIRVISENEVEIALSRPFEPFPERLAISFAYIYPREAVEQYGKDFARHPVGTGPYQFKSWIPDDQILLKRNPLYREKDGSGRALPFTDQVEFRFFRSETTMLHAFLQGSLAAIPITPAIKDAVSSGAARDGAAWQTVSHPQLRVEYWVFVLDRRDTPDPRIRKAINIALDREQLCKRAFSGLAQPAREFIPPLALSPGFTQAEFKTDVEAAKRLLARAGFNGTRRLTMPVTVNNDTVAQDLALEVKRQLSEIGIDVRIEIVDFAGLLDAVVNGKAPVIRLYLTPMHAHPEIFVMEYVSSLAAPAGFNFARYRNPKFDALYWAAVSGSDRAPYAELTQILVEDAPIVPLCYPLQSFAVRRPWQGFTLGLLEAPDLRRLERAKP